MIDYELDFKVYIIEFWLFSIVATLLQETYNSYQNSRRLNLEKLQCLPRLNLEKLQCLPRSWKKILEIVVNQALHLLHKGLSKFKFKSSLEFRDRSGTYMIQQRLVPASRSSFSLVLPEESTQVHILIDLKNIQSWTLLNDMQISYITVSPWFRIYE